MSGTRGPVPQRSTQRRRTNAPAIPVEVAPGVAPGAEDPSTPPPDVEAGGQARGSLPPPAEPPAADPGWVPAMARWWASLVESQQRAWYEPSDWAVAAYWCDVMTAAWPPNAAMASAFQSAAGELLSTEGARRRVSIELARAKPADGDRDDATGFVLSLVEELEAEASGA